jgi:hypothetical protein
VSLFPLDIDGNYLFENHRKWFAERQKEQEFKKDDFVSMQLSSGNSQFSDDTDPRLTNNLVHHLESSLVLSEGALASLPIQEQMKVFDDAYGFCQPIDESPGFVAQVLAALEKEISQKKSRVYDLALAQSRDYVENINFRLMFLRSTCFDVAAATKCLMKFLGLKLKYFGEKCLIKELAVSDLSVGDIFNIETGIIQALPERDRWGRLVLCIFPQKQFELKLKQLNVRELFSEYAFAKYIMPDILLCPLCA